MKRLSLLFLIESLAGGGAERILSILLKNLDKTKFDVTLCCVVDTGKYIEEVKPFVRYRYILPNPELLGGLSAIIYKIRYTLVYKLLPLKLVYLWCVPHRSDVEVAFVEGFATKLLSFSTNKRSKKIAWVHIDLERFHWTRQVYSSDSEEAKCYQAFDNIVTVADSVKTAFIKVFPSVTNAVLTLYNPIESASIRRQSEVYLNKTTNKAVRLVSSGRFVLNCGY